MEYVRCVCVWFGLGRRGGEWMRGLLDMCLCLGCGGVGGEWVGGLDQGMEGRCYVCVSLDSLCRWQVQVSVYCA